MKSLYVRSPILKILLGIAAVIVSLVVILAMAVTENVRMELQTGNWDGREIESGAALFSNNCANCHGLDGKGLPGVAPALHSHYFFTNRLEDVGWQGSLEDYVQLTVMAGRPSKRNTQWAQMMPTWSNRMGGPLRDDQVDQVVAYVLNWEDDAIQQTAEEDPWQPFLDVSKAAELQSITADPNAVVEPSASENGTPSGEPRSAPELFTAMACIGCHNLNEPQTDTNRGPVGPNMANLNEIAPNRVAGMDAETYVHTSIINPGAYVVEGYVNGIMPANLAEKMSEEEINALVLWLLDPNRSME